jgi:DNA-directed RNA polymerase subunit beta'
MSTHGSRKGLADTALRTADAGYLTRRLVDVAQDLIINDFDCGTENGLVLRRSDDIAGQSLGNRIFGRVAAEHIVDPDTGEIVIERMTVLDREKVRQVVASGVDQVTVFSPLSCEQEHGLCQKCYGMDFGRGKMVEIGAAVGIVAAQSIGEPGTQLTLRTFHTGGVAAGGDITTGLPRVEELFEARRLPKGEAVVTEIAGIARVEQSDRYSNMRVVRVEHSEMLSDGYDIPEGWKILVKDEDEVSQGDVLVKNEDNEVVARQAGRVRIEDDQVIVSYEYREEEDYDIPSNTRLIVKDGEQVEPGQPLTEGSLNPHNILRIQGRESTQIYLLSEVQKVYRSQGQNIHDKHFEVIVTKMLSRVTVNNPGDCSEFLPGDLADRLVLQRINEKLLSEGKTPAKYTDILLGITKASLTTDSFLSASSFQHTIKVLAGAAISASEDPLYGLKENVIIGKLIPAGTGWHLGPFAPKVPDPDIDELPLASITGGEPEEEETLLVDAILEEALVEETDPTPAD